MNEHVIIACRRELLQYPFISNHQSYETLAEHTQTYVPQDSNEKHEKSLNGDVIVRQLDISQRKRHQLYNHLYIFQLYIKQS